MIFRLEEQEKQLDEGDHFAFANRRFIETAGGLRLVVDFTINNESSYCVNRLHKVIGHYLLSGIGSWITRLSRKSLLALYEEHIFLISSDKAFEVREWSLPRYKLHRAITSFRFTERGKATQNIAQEIADRLTKQGDGELGFADNRTHMDQMLADIDKRKEAREKMRTMGDQAIERRLALASVSDNGDSDAGAGVTEEEA